MDELLKSLRIMLDSDVSYKSASQGHMAMFPRDKVQAVVVAMKKLEAEKVRQHDGTNVEMKVKS